MDLNAVAEALAATVTAAQINVNDQRLTATSYDPDAVTPPHFFAAEIAGEYHQSYVGLMRVTWTWRLIGSRADDISGQHALRELASSTGTDSLLSVLEAARGAPGQPALSGACNDFVVQRVTGPRLVEVGSTQYYGLEFQFLVVG